VYGMSTGVITAATEPVPCSLYGKSKLAAEKALQDLRREDFKVCIVRPPMIYGNACKGNYRPLAKLARKTPIFPDVKNERSMLYIDNLCELLRLLVENEEAGIFFPQDKEYVKTSEMVKQIGTCHGRKPALTKVFNPMLRLLSGVGVVKKVFGSLVYEKPMSVYDKGEYRIKEFAQAIEESEK
ncbi:MAG: NAD-dependent epimerase/dehydratase family protein, partial [Lachnospiraceae bacterium]|nr:NAD-dependent epimerase/dehydratase family protein [Lachnospiraceae bacterium]